MRIELSLASEASAMAVSLSPASPEPAVSGAAVPTFSSSTVSMAAALSFAAVLSFDTAAEFPHPAILMLPAHSRMSSVLFSFFIIYLLLTHYTRINDLWGSLLTCGDYSTSVHKPPQRSIVPRGLLFHQNYPRGLLFSAYLEAACQAFSISRSTSASW